LNIDLIKLLHKKESSKNLTKFFKIFPCESKDISIFMPYNGCTESTEA
jgi:hypothetical protein